MNYSDFMIPAQENLLTTQVMIEREELIDKYYPLLCFSTYSDDKFDLKYFQKLAKKYHRPRVIRVSYSNLLYEIEFGASGEVAQYTSESELIKCISKENFNKDTQMRDFMTRLQKVLIDYAKKKNVLIVVDIRYNDFLDYSLNVIQTYPVIMINMPRLRSYVTEYIKPFITNRKIKDTNFNRAFSTTIKKSLIVKYTPDLELYHISRNLTLTELEPRLTHRPINAQENMRIPRISCAPTVDGCFRGAQINTDAIVQVYKLQLTPDSVIVRPDTYLVPDRDVSDEYWVLTKTKVIPISRIKIIKLPNGNLKFEEIVK